MPIGLSGAIALGTAAIGAGTTLYTASNQADATKKAAAQANATQANAQAVNMANEHPYMAGGAAAVDQQANLLGLHGADAANTAMGEFTSSPGYQYQLTQGLNAIDHGAAASGMLRSGNTLRAEQTLGNNLASSDFGNYYNRLAGLTSVGQNAATGVGNAGLQTAAGIASTNTSGANQLSNIYGNEAAGVTGAIGGAAKNVASSLGASGMVPLFGSTAANNNLNANNGGGVSDGNGGVWI